jgi:hypothetical protein
MHLALQQVVVQVVEDARAEGGRLARARLRLLDHIQVLGEGHDALLLDRRWLLKACAVAWRARRAAAC